MILQGQFPVQLLLVCVFLNVRTRKNRDEGRSKQWQFFNEIVTLLFVLFFMAQQFSKLTCFKGRKVGHIFATYVLLTFFFFFGVVRVSRPLFSCT